MFQQVINKMFKNNNFIPILLFFAVIILLKYQNYISMTEIRNLIKCVKSGKRVTISKPNSLDSTNQQDKAFEELTTELRQVGGIEYKCPNLINRGNWHDCNSSPFIARKQCLVYSFGINYDFRFDDAMARVGCEVHSFDPSMGNTTKHIRKSEVHFHPIGIGGKSNDAIIPRMDQYTKKHPKKTWKVRTLRQIMESLGHEDRILDILKIDIETYEWEVLQNILSDNLTSRIRQLELEFHIFPNTADVSNYVELLQIYRSLKKAGFSRYTCTVYRFDNTKKVLQAECGLVNFKFDFYKYPLKHVV
ncbi:probable methyltransferase-like protein 24 [Mytilus trossulus]|uniref:probable methyltransferase-like protein 24 n=1 Tax=Mytilus trossulus TaxID=6551 RepID=UPI00300542D0